MIRLNQYIKAAVQALIFCAFLLNAPLSLAHNKVAVIPLGGSEAQLVTQSLVKHFPAGEFNVGSASPGVEIGYTTSLGDRFRLINGSETASVGLVTSLELPQGATITSVTCYMLDDDATYNTRSNSSFTIYRRALTSTTATSILTPLPIVTSGSSPNIVEFTTNSITSPIIDNTNYFYNLRFFMQLADNSNGFVTPPVSTQINFYGCSIYYDHQVLTAP